MSKNLKKMISYYKPYLGVFWADMFFATVSAAVALVIPLVIRYVTSTLIYMEPQAILGQIRWIALMLFALVAVDCYSRFFIANQGHVMGAKIEYDMRAEIFAHFQKLSFSFYDDQKVGQLMSRITTDLFDITELMHHGPENIILSLIKIIGAFVILMSIKPALALAAFAVLPFMFLFAYYMNGKMRRAFRSNRERIADINAQIEDNLSGIRVVKSFANEDIEKEKFRQGNEGFLRAKNASSENGASASYPSFVSANRSSGARPAPILAVFVPVLDTAANAARAIPSISPASIRRPVSAPHSVTQPPAIEKAAVASTSPP
mgnify:CR=1 FL=1